jgi:NADH dehydrogenase/NADH:ubiquinone oxidoreductase subunit G
MRPHYPPKEILRQKFDFFWTITEIKAAEPPSKTSAPEVIEAYQRAKAELEAKCKEAVELAFLDYMKTIREVVADLSLKMREGKVIRNDSLEKVRKLHDWSRDMNIFGYKPLEEELAKLKAGLDGVDIKALKNNDALKAELAGLADQVAAVASKTEDVNAISGNYKRMIDLS